MSSLFGGRCAVQEGTGVASYALRIFAPSLYFSLRFVSVSLLLCSLYSSLLVRCTALLFAEFLSVRCIPPPDRSMFRSCSMYFLLVSLIRIFFCSFGFLSSPNCTFGFVQCMASCRRRLSKSTTGVDLFGMWWEAGFSVRVWDR